MKKLTLILSCLVFLLSAVAQAKIEKNHKKFAEKIKHEKLNQKKKFEKEKLIFFQKQTSLLKIQNQWDNEDKVILTYDIQNNRTSEIWQSYWDGIWENISKSVCYYDDNNNATSGFYQYWSDDDWVDNDGEFVVFYNNMQSYT